MLALEDLDQFSIRKFVFENLQPFLQPGSVFAFNGANYRNTPGVRKATESTFLREYEIKKDLNLPYFGYIEIVKKLCLQVGVIIKKLSLWHLYICLGNSC